MLPLAGYTLHADEGVRERQRSMARAFNLPVVWGTSARLNGRSLSVARDVRVPAIYVENGGGGGCDPHRVEQNVQGCLNVARVLGMLDGPRRKPKCNAWSRTIGSRAAICRCNALRRLRAISSHSSAWGKPSSEGKWSDTLSILWATAQKRSQLARRGWYVSASHLSQRAAWRSLAGGFADHRPGRGVVSAMSSVAFA